MAKECIRRAYWHHVTVFVAVKSKGKGQKREDTKSKEEVGEREVMRLDHRFVAPAVNGREARGVGKGLRGKESLWGGTLRDLLAVCLALVVEGTKEEGGRRWVRDDGGDGHEVREGGETVG